MITEETVFIIGAGANVPYGFPTGKGLRKQICYDWWKLYDKIIGNELKASGGRSEEERNQFTKNLLDEAREFINAFRRSSTESIDLFLGRNPELSAIGKRAIATCIKFAESQSKFREDMSDESQDWYSYLFTKLTDKLATPDSYKRIGENKVSFITFNYDRSLEYFLYTSLSNSFRSIPSENLPVKEILPFDFIHVYGQLWNIPWQGGDSIEYRVFNRFKEIDAIKDGIRVINERADGNLDQAKDLISRAKRIFFLGFGFADENLSVLDIPNIFDRKQSIYGTTKGFTARERNKIINRLKDKSDQRTLASKETFSRHLGDILLANMDCRSFLREYL